MGGGLTLGRACPSFAFASPAISRRARSLTRGLHRVADTLRASLGAAVDIALTDNVTAIGRRADELLTMTEGDELDVCYFSSSYLTARVPSLDLFDRPFRFADRAAAHAFLSGPAAQRIAEDVAQATATGFSDSGTTAFATSPTAAGRSAARPTARACGSARSTTPGTRRSSGGFGFEPVFLDVRDLPKAVAEGTVDAQENPLTNMVNFELYRHHRFVSLTGHLFGLALLLVNRSRFERWPAEVRTALTAAAEAATPAQWRDAAAEDDLCHRHLLAEGIQIVPASAIDRTAFEQAAG